MNELLNWKETVDSLNEKLAKEKTATVDHDKELDEATIRLTEHETTIESLKGELDQTAASVERLSLEMKNFKEEKEKEHELLTIEKQAMEKSNVEQADMIGKASETILRLNEENANLKRVQESTIGESISTIRQLEEEMAQLKESKEKTENALQKAI
eukprot:15029693-Ditylum_brightwellii.AAC.1